MPRNHYHTILIPYKTFKKQTDKETDTKYKSWEKYISSHGHCASDGHVCYQNNDQYKDCDNRKIVNGAKTKDKRIYNFSNILI